MSYLPKHLGTKGLGDLNNLQPISAIVEQVIGEEEEKDYQLSDHRVKDFDQPPQIPVRASSRRKTASRRNTWNQNNQKKTKPVVVLMPLDNGDKASCGSMYDMFQSEMFSLSMFMGYFYKKFDNEGIHQFLTNKLFSYPIEQIEFFVPQLCYLLIKKESKALEKFLTEKCSQSISTFFLINWCFQAFSDADKKDKRRVDRIAQLEASLEQAMVNGSLDVTDQPTQTVQQYFQDKANKLKYEQSVRLFINNLIEISLTLKSKRPEDRKQVLKDYISKANRAVDRYRERNKEVLYCYGITFPFASCRRRSTLPFAEAYEDPSRQKSWNSNCIVRICPEEATCFNTKKRVPYRIVVETIDLKELEIKQPKYPKLTYLAKSSRSDLNLDENISPLIEDFLSTNTDGQEDSRKRLEDLMRDIVNSKRTRDFGDLKKLQEQEDELELQKQKTARKTQGASFFQAVMSQMQASNKLKDLSSQQEKELFESQAQQIITQRQRVQQIMMERKKFKTQKENLEFDVFMRRFEILFPTKNIERSQSSEMQGKYNKKTKRDKQKLESQFDFNRQNNYRFKHIRIQELTTLRRIKFFKMLLKKYPQSAKKIWDIYRSLQLDLYDMKYQKQLQNSQQAIIDEELEIHHRVGPWDELWEDKAQLIRRSSPFELFESYRLRPIIVKGGDDLRQEILAMQVIQIVQETWSHSKLDLWVRPYEIIVTSAQSGVLEFCTDTLSIDGLKKKMTHFKTLDEIFANVFAHNLEQSQLNFTRSLVGYSIICYILQIKDRHNGNILMDAYGHLIHIDFGFMLVTSPGGINFESAPFKFTNEYVQIMGGKFSQQFMLFKELMFKGLQALRRVVDDIVNLLEIMMHDSDIPCFEKFDLGVFRERFFESATDREVINNIYKIQLSDHVNRLIDASFDNWKTIQYDNFQKMTNGIMP